MQQRRYAQASYDASAGRVSGLLAPYGVTATVKDARTGELVRERIALAAFGDSPQLAELNLMHLASQVVSTHVRLDHLLDGLHLEAELDGPQADLAIRLLERGGLRGFSVDFVDVDRPTIGGVNEVREALLLGASLVDWPAYPQPRPQLREQQRGRLNRLGGVWL